MTLHVVACPRCTPAHVENSDVGGVAFGGCQICDGTGLVAAPRRPTW